MLPEAVFFVFSMGVYKLLCIQCCDQLRNHFMQITYHAIVSHLEDRCSFIVVDSDDVIRILHTGDVLDCTGDTTGDIDLRFNCRPGLSDLTGLVDPSCVYCGTGCCNDTAQAFQPALRAA